MQALLDGLDRYDTQLPPDQERTFQAWRAKLPANLQGTGDYDLRAAFLANAKQAANGHLTGDYKKPNHFTFPDDGKYASPAHPGGHWSKAPDATWTYQAAPDFERFHTPDDLLNYFQAVENGKREDGTYGPPNHVVLPRGTR